MPNLYVVTKDYLISKTMSIFPGCTTPMDAQRIVNEYNLCNVEYDISKGMGEIEALYKELATTVQTQNRMTSVIKFLANVPLFSRILCGFNPAAVISMYHSSADLLDAIIRDVPYYTPRTNTSWKKYAKSLYSGALLLSKFATLRDFKTYITGFATIYGVDFPTYQKTKPKGTEKVYNMGYILACNFLKEVGFYNYAKPDVHLMDIFVHLGLCPPSDASACLAAIVAQSAKCRVTPYELDKVIWLICSGHYYRHRFEKYGGGAKRLKPPYIADLSSKLASGHLTL